jgi:hypothetical protein
LADLLAYYIGDYYSNYDTYIHIIIITPLSTGAPGRSVAGETSPEEDLT